MPDIDPAALTRTESFSHTNSSHAVSSKANGSYPQISQKPAKAANTAQRIDIEPLYTSLKVAISDRWGDYKEAISLFVLGTNTPNFSIIYAHNTIANRTCRQLESKRTFLTNRPIHPQRPFEGALAQPADCSDIRKCPTGSSRSSSCALGIRQ